VDFNVKMNELEISLQQFINQSFENIGSIEQSLTLLKNYQNILHRENLRSDLDSKLSVIFNNYGAELSDIELIYEKNKHSPPIARNMPPVAGNITWARHLLRKIEDPMDKFQGNSSVLASKEVLSMHLLDPPSLCTYLTPQLYHTPIKPSFSPPTLLIPLLYVIPHLLYPP
jgi:dynein heavy chain